MSEIITMYHGGRNLEFSFRDILGNNSKQMEYGPGLYLTNFLSTAQKYSKGGGSIYKVSFKKGISIDKVSLLLNDVFNFIKNTRMTNKKELFDFIKNKYNNTINAEYFLNLLINFNCLTPSNSILVRNYLIDNNIDYLYSENYGGWPDQYIVVIFNPKIITKVEKIKSKDLSIDDNILKNDLLKEYLNFIKETPIEDISHIGNSSTATNFTKPEIKMLKTEKYEKRLRNAFKNTPFVFDIVFLYHNEFDANTKEDNEGLDVYIPRYKANLPSLKFDNNEIKGKPGVITFVLQGNLSPEDRIPITPWILAHKIGHSFEPNLRNSYSLLDDIYYEYNKNLSNNEKTNLFNFKSWKNKRFNDNLYDDEFIVELVAMYLIKGQISANTTNEILLYQINELNNKIYKMFDNAKGKVFTEL